MAKLTYDRVSRSSIIELNSKQDEALEIVMSPHHAVLLNFPIEFSTESSSRRTYFGGNSPRSYQERT